MKKILLISALFVGLLSFSPTVEAKTIRVNSYYKPSTRTYVPAYYKTSPNKTKLDNYSTKGNYNPYSGKVGRVNIYKW